MEMLHKPFDLVKERMVWYLSRNSCMLIDSAHLSFQAGGSGSPDCAARSLLENVIEGSKDPAHMELMCKSALGSMYGGTYTRASQFTDRADAPLLAGTDTVRLS